MTRILKDVRYYECSDVPGPGKPSPTTRAGAIPAAAHRIGQRVACMLQAEGFSVGEYDHVYVAFTPALPEKQVVPTDFGLEWWQRYVAYGVPPDFKALPEGARLKFIEEATFDILGTLQPEQTTLLDGTRERLRQYGSRARILRAAKDTKAYGFEVWFDVPPWPETAYLYVTAKNNASGEVLEAPPFPLNDYEDAFPLVSRIAFAKGTLTLHPRKSFRAGLSTRTYPTPIQFPLSEFAAPRITEADTAQADHC